MITCFFCAGMGSWLSADEVLRVRQGEAVQELHWESENGTTSFLQHSVDLRTWDYTPYYDVGDGSARIQELGEDLRSGQSGAHFYRLQFHPTNLLDPDDTDADGLSNTFELNHGYIPVLTDTDDDGTPDGDEDLDGDGESNSLEIANGTDASDSSSNSGGDEDASVTVKLVARGKTIPASGFIWGWDGTDDTIFLYYDYQLFDGTLGFDFDSAGMGDWVDTPQISSESRYPYGVVNAYDEDNTGGYGRRHAEVKLLIEGGSIVDHSINRTYLLITNSPAGQTVATVELVIPEGASESQVFSLKPATDGEYLNLLPVEIVPDYNRDGMIDAQDRHKVTKGNPFRWWVNDDKDGGEYATGDESNVPGQADGNFSDGMINGVSDLTDFFPIYLDLKAVMEVLPPGIHDYRLRQDDEALNFAEAVELIPDEDPDYDGAGAYWRSPVWADIYQDLPVQQITAAGVSLSNSFLDGLKEGRGILLLEYRKSSEAPLELEIWKGGQKVSTIAFHAKVDSVEKMYRHVNLYKATGTESSQLHQTGEPENYPDDRTNDKAFVMIHGYASRNNGAKNDRIQRGFQSEIFRRLHQVGSKAKYVAVYWDSATGMDYHRSVYQAFKTSPFIGPELGFLTGNEITLAAHSLGNIVASNAICHEGFKPANYFLINAASPIEAYNPDQSENGDDTLMKMAMTEKEWKPYHERFCSPNWHACFPASDHRSKLKWKGRFANIGSLTRPFNFYSTGEDVVANPRSGEDDFNLFRKIWKRIAENESLERHAWVGQEFIKGGTSIAAGIAFERNHGGWQHIGPFGSAPGHKGMGFQDPLNSPGVYSLYTAAQSNQRLASGQYTNEHLAQFGLFKRFESPAYDALYAPINDANRNWPDYGGFAWQNPYTQAQGSALAGQKDTQWVILATAMPSVSFAAAANAVDEMAGFDMNKNDNKNGWPNMPERGEYLNDWQHGDFAGGDFPGDEVAATFTKIVYKKMVSRGRLNE